MVEPTSESSAERTQLNKIIQINVAQGEVVSYGPDPDQFIEFYGNPHSARSYIVLLHGGYFRQRYDLKHMRPMAEALATRDAFVALVEYRRAGGSGGFPRTLADVSMAIEVAAARFKSSRAATSLVQGMAVAGHSAGGCLALSWASHQPAEGTRVRLYPLAPVTDLMREVTGNLAGGAVLDYLGAAPSDHLDRYLTEDPRSRAAMIPPRIAVRIIHGTEDHIVDIAFSRNFPAPRTELDGASHFDLIDPHSRYFEAVARMTTGIGPES